MKHRLITLAGLTTLFLSSHCSTPPGSEPGATGGSSGGSVATGVGGAQGGAASGAGGTVLTGGASAVTGGAAGIGGSAGTAGSTGFGGSAGLGGTGGANAGGTGGAGAGGTSGAGGSAGSAGSGGTAFNGTFALGADISSVQERIEQNNAKYVDTDGQEKSIFALLKNHGFNYIRLRTFVDPGSAYGYAQGTGGDCVKAEDYCDKAHTVEFAQQVKAAGMGLLLDFHYSDNWADPGKQIVPAPWRSASTIAARAALLKTYTKDVLNALVAAGARPDMVQVGNEITPGMLIHVPDGDTDCWGGGSAQTTPNGVASDGNWPNLATLLKAGIEGVKEVDSTIQVMLHIENTDDLNGVRWWVDSALDEGVSFDVLGLSCYTAFQGQPSVWQNTLETMADEFPNLKFVIAEYNPERGDANEIVAGLPNGRGLGTFFWEPTQSGEWGQSMFTEAWSGNNVTYTAKQADFAEFDTIANDLGL